MPSPISVVVPTLDAAAALERLLPDLVEGLEQGLIRELVISDGGSRDATERIAEAAGAVWVTGPAGRGGQLRRGVAAARGDWLLVLHADTGLPAGWSVPVRAALGQPELAHAFRLSFRARGLAPVWVAGWANLRSRLVALPYGDQGLLIARPLYDEVGGYPEIPLMEDVALVRALRGRVRMLPARVSTGAERYQREGWLRRGGRNLWTLVRFLAGADPEALARSYRAGSPGLSRRR
ncbi:TIGR04283 family arsenosugar biosynthesis glycosyltransferase [Tropicimonas sp. IMCC34043]|uniref:TIGR04283 family arsenosugar biosynthesis glycosyltransferase n=1 Tax=Tropicimonas sp. IMCC34043 TaxID=2248760 RepID=UPI000E27232D|nr:TIGR04283 family arsenosugar biosynthesis glycosyltransferase [Tropicimonas sp. IMCC34043]